MDLKTFLASYPEVHLATAADDVDLREFFHRVPMKGKGMQLQYLRAPTFAAFLDCHSATHFVFFVRGKNGEIEGSGTIIIRPGMVHGKPANVGYLGDLRIDHVRRWGRYWRDFYLDLMQKAEFITDFAGARYFLTAMLKQNTRAQKALGESAMGYHPFHSYKMVNVLRAWLPVRDHFKMTSWNEVPTEVLWSFHREANRQKPLGWMFEQQHHEGEWRLKHWPTFSLSDGVALSDEHGIAVSGAFWYPGSVKKIMVQRMPTAQKRALALIRPFLKLPQEGEELRCLYLTMLDKRVGLSEKEWLLGVRQMLKIGLRLARERGFHCVSLAEYEEAPFKMALRPYFALKTDLELYFVDPARNPVGDFSTESPGFEMGLV